MIRFLLFIIILGLLSLSCAMGVHSYVSSGSVGMLTLSVFSFVLMLHIVLDM